MNAADVYRIIDKYYPAGSSLRDIYLRHCRSVAALSLEILDRKKLPLDRETVEAAALLHDIGIYATDAPSIECHGPEPYLRHGVIGAELLRREGVPEEIAAVAERHTGAGLTAREIRDSHLPLPECDLLPRTLLEKLVCYADKFYSKSGSMQRKSLEKVRASMARFSPAVLARFDALHTLFA